MPLELVAFDLDGTLVDSEPGIVQCIRQTVEGLGLSPSTVEAWRSLIGIPLGAQLEQLLPLGREGDVEAGVALYRSFYFQLSADQMGTPFPGIPALLAALQGRVKLAIATSKGQRGVDTVLENLTWQHVFDPVVTPDQVSRPKPDPESLERILAQHGVSPDRAVYVGDSRFDIQMARAAGVTAFGVGWGVQSPEQLQAAGASRCFETVAQLGAALKAMTSEGA